VLWGLVFSSFIRLLHDGANETLTDCAAMLLLPADEQDGRKCFN